MEQNETNLQEKKAALRRFMEMTEEKEASASLHDLATQTAMFLAEKLNSIGVRTEVVTQEHARRELSENSASSEFSVADIQKLDYEWNGEHISLKAFAQAFSDLIRQKDRTEEDVERIAKAYIESVKADPAAFIPQVKAENMSHWRYFVLNDGSVYSPDHLMARSPEYSTQRGLWEIYSRVLGDRMEGFMGMAGRYASLTSSERESFLEMEREVSGSDLLQNTLETNAQKVNEQRNRDVSNLIQYFEGNNDYTSAEKALILKGSMTYSYSEKKKDGGRNEVKLVRITDANDVAVPVLGGEAASIVDGLRKGLNFKDSLILARSTMDDSRQRSVPRDFTGWKRYEKSDREEDIVILNKDAAGTGWCTGGSVSTARTHLSGGDFHIYFENGEPLIAIRTENGRLAEAPRGAHDGQFCTPREEEIAFRYIQEGHGIDGGSDYIADMQDLRTLGREDCTWRDVIRIPARRRYENGEFGGDTGSWGEAAQAKMKRILFESREERFREGYYTPQEIAEYNVPHENVVGLINDDTFTIADDNWKNLRFVRGSIAVECNCSLDACESVGGAVIARAGSTLKLPVCESVGEDVLADESSTLELPFCKSVRGSVEARECSILNLPVCKNVREAVEAYKGSTLNLPVCESVGRHVIAHVDSTLELPACKIVGLSVIAGAGSTLKLPVCEKVGRKVKAYQVSTLDLSVCKSVEGDIDAYIGSTLILPKINRAELHLSDGTVYGYERDNVIYLTPEGINPNTPIHEYAHLWAKAMQATRPDLWAEIKTTLKGEAEWDSILSNDDYLFLHDDEDRLAGEVLATMVGNGAETLLTGIASEVLDGGFESEEERKQAVADGLKAVIDGYVTRDLFELSQEYEQIDKDILTLGVLKSLVEQKDIVLNIENQNENKMEEERTVIQQESVADPETFEAKIGRMLSADRGERFADRDERFKEGFYTPEEIKKYYISHMDVVGLLNDGEFTITDNNWKNLRFVLDSLAVKCNCSLDVCEIVAGSVYVDEGFTLNLPVCKIVCEYVEARKGSTLELPVCKGVGMSVTAHEGSILKLPACESVDWDVKAHDGSTIELPVCESVGGEVEVQEGATLIMDGYNKETAVQEKETKEESASLQETVENESESAIEDQNVNKMEQVQLKKVDDLYSYIVEKGIKMNPASKFTRINARKAEAGEEIVTIASDGVQETVNYAKEGDFVVNNVETPDNKWIIMGDVFEKKYEKDETRSTDGMSVYKPKGGPMLAGQIDEAISFTAPWGEEMNIDAGGYILMSPSNPKDIYGISKKDFVSTYKSNNLIFLLGGHDLEMQEIKKMLDENNILYLDNNLAWGAKLSDYHKELVDMLLDRASGEPIKVYGIELGSENFDGEKQVILDRMKEELETLLTSAEQEYADALDAAERGAAGPSEVTRLNKERLDLQEKLFNFSDYEKSLQLERIDHHNENAGKKSSIEQVADIIGAQLDRHQQLVAANDSGYILAMEEMGATDEEIAEIIRLDRTAQGHIFKLYSDKSQEAMEKRIYSLIAECIENGKYDHDDLYSAWKDPNCPNEYKDLISNFYLRENKLISQLSETDKKTLGLVLQNFWNPYPDVTKCEKNSKGEIFFILGDVDTYFNSFGEYTGDYDIKIYNSKADRIFPLYPLSALGIDSIHKLDIEGDNLIIGDFILPLEENAIREFQNNRVEFLDEDHRFILLKKYDTYDMSQVYPGAFSKCNYFGVYDTVQHKDITPMINSERAGEDVCVSIFGENIDKVKEFIKNYTLSEGIHDDFKKAADSVDLSDRIMSVLNESDSEQKRELCDLNIAEGTARISYEDKPDKVVSIDGLNTGKWNFRNKSGIKVAEYDVAAGKLTKLFGRKKAEQDQSRGKGLH